ncbi:MAG: CDP-alcohol phosphatidyltransferase family protein [Candidatus Eisenbacteria bacterium]|nr:CDP-alcohol phosphatidyltransferase family protein [Candidatus Eisenbacteria bacterium]
MPFFVWKRGQVGDQRSPAAVRSAVHSGYAFSAIALLIGVGLWFRYHDLITLFFIAAHLSWISAVFSLVLLNPSFLEDLSGHPLERLGAANHLTLSRIVLLPLLLYLILREHYWAGLAGYVLLGVTDVLDGWIARHNREESKLGFVLDPFGDILFHLGIFVSLSLGGIFPWWVGAGGAPLRGAARRLPAPLWAQGEIWIQPTVFGKATGLIVAALTTAVLLLAALDRQDSATSVWLGRAVGLLVALGVFHVLVIGWINFHRPVEGGQAVYRKSFGLLVGRRDRR